MPEQRGITISLQSQYDALSLPELLAPVSPDRESESVVPPKSRHESDQTNVVEAYTPIYPGSQFWILFRCNQPVDETRYYYFKLFLDGKCVLSWGCGENNAWSGRVGFGIFESSGDDLTGQPLVEKRAFVFPHTDDTGQGGSFEIRVYRAAARKRQDRPIRMWKQNTASEGMKMKVAGYMKPQEPRRMYAYALLDSVNKPYASFVYHCHTGQQLRQLGLNIPAEFDIDDIIKASPSKRAPIVSLSTTPPIIRPVSPPSMSMGKDSLALRHSRQSVPPCIHSTGDAVPEQDSPTKERRERSVDYALTESILAYADGLVDTETEAHLLRAGTSVGRFRNLTGRWKRRSGTNASEQDVQVCDGTQQVKP
ncbi:hypothetical protein CERZMDRAFT_82557 [Cercospora zeae-maydis SCOH1-5]|uniref:Uncharacterized protein n=1 Tax=Cercospora zeae-maydis SCOH1-5 TaxID=717836 RepID=A0A6A6FMD3_9PEZI|nr:hypothetical protein CERZMDRAFT_82557 [Cercospora zeae-maydis SCOH1-5]